MKIFRPKGMGEVEAKVRFRSGSLVDFWLPSGSDNLCPALAHGNVDRGFGVPSIAAE